MSSKSFFPQRYDGVLGEGADVAPTHRRAGGRGSSIHDPQRDITPKNRKRSLASDSSLLLRLRERHFKARLHPPFLSSAVFLCSQKRSLLFSARSTSRDLCAIPPITRRQETTKLEATVRRSVFGPGRPDFVVRMRCSPSWNIDFLRERLFVYCSATVLEDCFARHLFEQSPSPRKRYCSFHIDAHVLSGIFLLYFRAPRTWRVSGSTWGSNGARLETSK